MQQLEAEVVEAAAILELAELKGRDKLPGTPLHALAVVSEYGAPWVHSFVATCQRARSAACFWFKSLPGVLLHVVACTFVDSMMNLFR